MIIQKNFDQGNATSPIHVLAMDGHVTRFSYVKMTCSCVGMRPKTGVEKGSSVMTDRPRKKGRSPEIPELRCVCSQFLPGLQRRPD